LTTHARKHDASFRSPDDIAVLLDATINSAPVVSNSMYNTHDASHHLPDTEVTEYIEIFYNRIRRHSALGNTAPSVFAETYY
jgi:hypothetical protein